ncbi:D-alanine--D-alanine ligase [Proteiniclasticum sp.]|jgi:D-alanine-D-alanine ligase|uniref:D-alanine--D-alanine ligase n=1 Tax=Proteiniclasticum sp. TaxID=2053595 RepID=UPI000E9C8342|nr:D-alanine--D-alanine ligase [Proteiniclasticum sp.]HBW13860.1 D-alanine--D-alanine ligase [Proteiniclasticum sp.]
MKIGVIMGGISSEREVSLSSGREILNHINFNGYEGVEIILDTKTDIFEKVKGIDFALLALHGKYGEDGTVQSILDSLEIPYSGCGMLSSALCMDKDLTKTVLRNHGVRTAEWFVVKNATDVTKEMVESLKYPVVVKPNRGGSSVATFICKSFDEVVEGVKEGLKVDSEVMVEEFIKGDEITVPILDGEALPTLIIKPVKGGFFDYQSKYEDGGAEEVIIEYEEALQSEINELALTTFSALKCDVYARVDFIVRDGVPYLLEINTLPGMTRTSLFPKSAKGIGLSYQGLLDRIIQSSLKLRAK